MIFYLSGIMDKDNGSPLTHGKDRTIFEQTRLDLCDVFLPERFDK